MIFDISIFNSIRNESVYVSFCFWIDEPMILQQFEESRDVISLWFTDGSFSSFSCCGFFFLWTFFRCTNHGTFEVQFKTHITPAERVIMLHQRVYTIYSLYRCTISTCHSCSLCSLRSLWTKCSEYVHPWIPTNERTNESFSVKSIAAKARKFLSLSAKRFKYLNGSEYTWATE